MKELERYLGSTYINSFQPDIMTETPATFPSLYMPTIPDLVIWRPKIDAEMTYLNKITSMKPSTKI